MHSTATVQSATNRNADKSHYLQDYLMICLTSNKASFLEQSFSSIQPLRRTVFTIEIFDDVNECVDFLTEVSDVKVYLILFEWEVGSKTLLPFIHAIPQLKAIFFLNKTERRVEDDEWKKHWFKIKGTFTNANAIGHILPALCRRVDQDAISISVIPNSNADKLNPDELDQTFIYTQLLKEILFSIEYDHPALKRLADYYRENYPANHEVMDVIDEFEQSYRLKSPIWWYTHPSSIFSTVNHALRTQQIDTIIKLGFFIRDLDQAIRRRCQDTVSRGSISSFTVYRGQALSEADFKRLRNMKGGLLSFNNFLSTSTDRIVSLTFADSVRYDSDLKIGILFKILAEPSKSTAPFTFVGDAGYFGDAEEEVLFSMHTIFRIGNMQKIDGIDRLWEVELTSTSAHDQQLQKITEQMREQCCFGLSGWYQLGVCKLR